MSTIETASVEQNLLEVWQQHTYSEFVLKDAKAALATMRSFTSCLAKGGQLHASGYRCAADKCLVDYFANGRDNQPFRSRRSATRPTSPEFLSLTKACPNSRDLDSVVVRPGSGDLVSTGAR
jgi:hypothetical protein